LGHYIDYDFSKRCVTCGRVDHWCRSGGVSLYSRSRTIDKRADNVLQGQADGVEERTLEILGSFGITDRILKKGNPLIGEMAFPLLGCKVNERRQKNAFGSQATEGF
jgi:hypothetical protein